LTPFEKKAGAVMLQLPLPSKPVQAARRTSREPVKLQNSFRFAQRLPPGGVNGVPLEDELELLELEELLLDEELELLELDEDDEELELDDELDELLLEEDELLDEELLLVPPSPVHVGVAGEVPSTARPWKPHAARTVWPGAGCWKLQQLVNWKVVPGLAPVRVEFQ
jgi:hypothetical protein